MEATLCHRHGPHLYSNTATTVKEGEANLEVKIKSSEESRKRRSPGPPPGISLADIPNEIVLYILEHLHDDVLYRLALVARRLHHLALPLYLSRKGFGMRPNDQFVSFNYNAQEVLKAVGIALFRPSLTRLHYAIDCWKSHDQLTSETAILLRALDKLDNLEEMVISFQNTIPPKNAQTMGMLEQYSHNSSALMRTAVYGFPGGLKVPTMSSLLDSILSTKCKSIVIRHCGSQTTALRYLGPSLAHEFSGMQNLPRWLIQSLPFPFLFDKSKSRLNHGPLRSFNLHSPMAFHSQLVHWTINTLNYSAITALSISRHQCTDEHSWALILPYIYVGTLTNLSIDFATIQPSTLLQFLRRHDHIKKLYLGRNIPPPNSSAVFSNRILREVTQLTAPASWLNYFFLSPGSLPLLASATILIRIPHTHGFRFTDLDTSLLPSSIRLKTMKELHLSLSFWSASSDWMVATAYADTADAAKIGLRNFITHMELCISVYTVPPSLIHRLPKWLAQFPVLRLLNILTLSAGHAAGSAEERQVLSHAIMSSSKIGTVKFGFIEQM